MMKNMRLNNTILNCLKFIFGIFILLFFYSCSSSKKVSNDYFYFKTGADTTVEQQTSIIFKPNDLLSIQVYSISSNQEQASIFNLPASLNTTMQGYQINDSGNIILPVVGAVKAAGLTKNELQLNLGQQLVNYIKNPSVIVKFLQFNVNVLGEVHTPGLLKFYVDRVTIIDALSAAGDLTDFGKRDNILVVREEEGKKISHSIDLRSKAVFNSPVYILHPNDIVYVSPNKFKLKGLNIDPEAQRRTGLLFNVITVFASIASLVIILIRH